MELKTVASSTEVVRVKSKLLQKWASLPDSLEKCASKGKNMFICFHSNIKKDHWDPDQDHPICYGCQRQFTIFFRRHHCRRCGKVFCYYCSGCKMRLDDNAEIGNDGYYHRVCFLCYTSKNVNDFQRQCEGQTYSLSATFNMYRKRQHNNSLSSIYPENRFLFEAMELCRPVIEVYLTKNHDTNIVNGAFKAVGGALKATGRDSVCLQCSTHIMVPKNRKQCSLCSEIFCKKCSNKDLIIYCPSNGKLEKCPEILLNNNFKEICKKYKTSKQYRLCLPCTSQLQCLLNKGQFHEQLELKQRAMCNLQFQIEEAIKQKDKGIKSRLLKTLSADECETDFNENNQDEVDLDNSFDFMKDSEIMASGSRISQKLIDEYFQHYQAISSLTPCTDAQTQLVYCVKKAMRDYYLQTKTRILKPSPGTN